MRILVFFILFIAFTSVEASNSQRIRSVKRVGAGRYMYECSTSFDAIKQPITVHAEYFKKCNSQKEVGPICRLELQDKKETQLEKFIVQFQNDIQNGKAEGGATSKCPESLGATREMMDSNGCTARVSICYPQKFVKNDRKKSDRMPASLQKPVTPKRTKVEF